MPDDNHDILKKFLNQNFDESQITSGSDNWNDIHKAYLNKIRKRRIVVISLILLVLLTPTFLFIRSFDNHIIHTEKQESKKTQPSLTQHSKNKNENLIIEPIKPKATNSLHIINSSEKTISKEESHIAKKIQPIPTNKIFSNTRVNNLKYSKNLPFNSLEKSLISSIVTNLDINNTNTSNWMEIYPNLITLNNFYELRSLSNNGLYLKINFSGYHNLSKYEIKSERIPEIHEDFTLIQAESKRLNMVFSGGINLTYKFMNKYSIQSGLFLTDYHSNINYNFTNKKIPVRDSATNKILAYLINPNATKTNSIITNSIKYLEIPIIFGYEQHLSNKFYLNYKTGFSYLTMISSKGQNLSYYNLTFSEIDREDYKTSNLAYMIGIGGYYNINNYYIIGIEPTIKGLFSSIYDDKSALISKPYFMGVNAILELKLNKK